VREVRSAAVDAAVAAAQALIKEKLSPDLAKKLVADSIGSVGSKLN
jgi:F0F1-type ATP synthase membrane subunit b/b'